MIVEGKEHLVRKSHEKKMKKMILKQVEGLKRTRELKSNIKIKKFKARALKSFKKSSNRVLALQKKLLNKEIKKLRKELNELVPKSNSKRSSALKIKRKSKIDDDCKPINDLPNSKIEFNENSSVNIFFKVFNYFKKMFLSIFAFRK